jgi:hypothetical protein
VVDFLVGTYEAVTRSFNRQCMSGEREERLGPGRPANQRVLYLAPHPKKDIAHRRIQSDGHNNLPNFVGPWMPRRDELRTHDLYCELMLTLFKPWRSLERDLKRFDQSWSDALEEFLKESPKCRFFISNIQYFHECSSAAMSD